LEIVLGAVQRNFSRVLDSRPKIVGVVVVRPFSIANCMTAHWPSLPSQQKDVCRTQMPSKCDLSARDEPCLPKSRRRQIQGEEGRAQQEETLKRPGPVSALEQTLTRGIISGVNRMMPGSPQLTLPFIQTDASINPGNSGGPLMNRCGEVIGVNTSILAEAQNIGFSIPINVAKNFLPDLLKHGRVIRPWLGISGQPVKKELMKIINLPLVDGFVIETIDPGSPAQKEGIHGGDYP
jgi:hypothetical protein